MSTIGKDEGKIVFGKIEEVDLTKREGRLRTKDESRGKGVPGEGARSIGTEEHNTRRSFV